MRRIALAAALLAPMFAAPAGGAEAGCRAVRHFDQDGDAYEVEVCEGSGSSGGAGSARRVGRRYQASELIRVVSAVDGRQCTIWATRSSAQGRQAVASRHDYEVVGDVFDTSVWDVWQQMVAAMPGCAAGADAAEQAVFGFLYEYPPPNPAPYIAPGYATTGKPAYLETRGPAVHDPPAVATPLGTLSVSFVLAAVTVDWGDASPPASYAAPAAPWPEGTVVHTYTHTGLYTVVVAAHWEVSWRLGDRTGQVTLTGAPSVIEDFPVHQLQAVRLR